MNVLSVLPLGLGNDCEPSPVVYKGLASRLVSSGSQQILDLLILGKPLISRQSSHFLIPLYCTRF